MVAVGVMIEGQEDLTWERWRHLCALTESLGFESLWRSDHFHSLVGEYGREALETWTALTLAAAETKRIRFGPLVCSVTFRHPSLLARMAAAVDRLSGGRLVCALGAGWNEGEHTAFGLPFPPVGARMEMLEEQAQVLRLLWSGDPVTFAGKHYSLDGARCLPRPAQDPMPLLLGGSGDRFLSIVARHASEWNSYGMTLERHRDRVETLRAACKDAGRDFDSIERSWMCGFVIGRDRSEISERGRRIQGVIARLAGMEVPAMLELLASNGWIVGTPEEAAEQLRERASIGAQRFMMQHHDHADDEALALVAREVVPLLA